MNNLTLQEWLQWIGSVHNREIELGLERVKIVATKLNILSPECPVVVVGGTNGKGSTVAGLESIFRTAGYNVGAFTSPILFEHNEYVRINTKAASDLDFCQAYAQIELARGEILLTAFEYHTLAALILFKKSNLDVWILEVGLGGRLDAVNIIDADVSVIASIGVDHVEWLGYTLEEISREKAGILRLNGYSVFGQDGTNHPLMVEANKIGTELICLNKNYRFACNNLDWCWQSGDTLFEHLPYNQLNVQNMALVLMVIKLLQPRLPVSAANITKGLTLTKLVGRTQVVQGRIERIFDVSHNPDAVGLLGEWLDAHPCPGRTLAVFSMLRDKDIPGSIAMISEQIDCWYVGPLDGNRAATVEQLQQAFTDLVPAEHLKFSATLSDAYDAAMLDATPQDRVVIFGSFHTVSKLFTRE